MLSPRQSQVRKANDDHIQKYLTVRRNGHPRETADSRVHPRGVSACGTPDTRPQRRCQHQHRQPVCVANTCAHRLWLSTLPSGIESATQDFGGVSLAGARKLNQAVEELVGGHIIASRVHSLGCPLTTSSMGVKAVQTALRGILLVALVAVVHGDEEDGHELGANEVCACVCVRVWFSFPAQFSRSIVLWDTACVVVGTHAALRLLTGCACFIVLRCTVQSVIACEMSGDV